jgi:hypothetical protein
MSLLAVMAVFLLHGTPLFPPAAFAIAVLIGLHMMISHYNTADEDRCAPFRCGRESSHRTWIVASVVAGAVSALRL